MSKNKPQIRKLGDRGILLQWDFAIDPANLQFLIHVKHRIADVVDEGVEITNTYNSLLLRYSGFSTQIDRDLKNLSALDFNALTGLVTGSAADNQNKTIIEVPVCYDKIFGLDLDFLSNAKKISINKLIDLHTRPLYTVYFIGFLPGFLYLGGMDIKLSYPRRQEPRLHIDKGAVGIADEQTGIYPRASPAGWQIIGNCPLSLFDAAKKNPCPFKAGDVLKFVQVDIKQYTAIQEEVNKGIYVLKNYFYNG